MESTRKERERALGFMQGAAMRCGDPFYTCAPGRGFRFVFVNEGACRHFGRSREELLLMRLPDVDMRLSHNDWERTWEEVRQKGSLFFETVHRYADGGEIPVAISVNFFSAGKEELLGGCIHDLRHQRAAVEALRESEQMLRSLFDMARDAMLVHTAQGEVIDINEPFCALHGITREQALGLTIAELSGQEAPMEEAPVLWERVLAGEPQLFVWPSRRFGDGSPFEAEIYLRPVRVHGEEAILANVRDLTEQRRVEMALHQTHELLESITEGTQDLITALDPQLRFISFNRAFQRTIENLYGSVPALGQSLTDILGAHPDDLEKALSRWNRALRGETFTDTQEYGDPARGRRIYEIRYSPVRAADGTFLGAAQIARDVTERARSAQALAEAKQSAEAANEAKSDFLGNISHELRTPMTVIISALELLDAADPSPAQKPLLQMAESASDRLMAIIEDLLELTRIDTGKLEISPQPYDLRTCVKNIVTMFAIPVRKKGLTFRQQISPGTPSQLVGDSDRIMQILANLVSNALKFTERGDISLYVEARGDSLYFVVSDTGIGIAPEKLNDIFAPFSQADVSSTRRFGGAGLGLAISRELAIQMGGALEARSEPGAGSVFTLRLPLVRAEAMQPEQGGPSLSSARGGRTGHILVAEDDPAIQKLITILLKQKGWTSEVASTGEEAVRLWQEGSYDLILMDLQMPQMDGLTATRRIRELEEERGGRICIVALTAHAGASSECLEAGMDTFLAKPVRAEALQTTLDECLSNLEPS